MRLPQTAVRAAITCIVNMNMRKKNPHLLHPQQNPISIITKHSQSATPKYKESQPHPSNTSSCPTLSSAAPSNSPSDKRCPSWGRGRAVLLY
jgi:hypothetical protein